MAAYLSSLVRSVVSGRTALDSFTCSIGEPVTETQLWKIHHGTKKADGSAVTVFVYEPEKTRDPSWMNLAKNAFKRIKTIRHPNMIKFIDGFESDAMVVIATERVQPLSSITYDLENKFDEYLISWGLHQVLNAVKFLTEDCNLVHGAIVIPSIYVDAAGEWKLFGFEYLCSLSEESPLLLTHYSLFSQLQKYKPPEVLKSKSWDVEKSCPSWATDIWYYGCLVYEIFNRPFSAIDEIKAKGNIPNSIFAVYKEFMKGDPKARLSPSQVLQKLLTKGEFFHNEFIQASSFLENFALKEPYEKEQFFRKLGETVNTFPDSYCKFKVLPELTKALEFGGAGSKVLTPLLKIGQKLTEEEYETHIVSSVIKLFNQPDRAIRVSLLENLPSYIDHIAPKLVNEKIFPQVATGFTDPTPAMRELTLKSMLLFAPKLTEKVMNNDLLRHFAKLQIDEEPGIRTNTTICLGKIAEHMNDATRKRILAAAFGRAARDPFPPARNAGVAAFMATSMYYDPEEVATKVLPLLCLLLVDPEISVQTQALKAVTQFMKIMEKYVKEGPKEATPGSDLRNPSGKTSQSSLDSWASWKSISSLAWGSSAAPATASPATAATQNPAAANITTTPPSGSTEELVSPTASKGKGMALGGASKQPVKVSDGWDDGLDDLLDNPPPKPKAAGSNGWGVGQEEEGDGWSSAPAKPKSAVSSFAKADDDDEWSSLERQETEEEKRARIEEARRRQQERKAQRMQAKAAGAGGFGKVSKD